MSWVNEAIFYHIYPLGFCGAPLKNDDIIKPRITKLTDWISHLKEISVNAVYLGPVCESSEHGYDTRDYYKIDGRLGDNETFAGVCKALHDNGIRVVLDAVFNHVGREFWAFKDVQKNGCNSKYCGWFHGLNFGGNSPLGDPFWYEGWQGHFNLVKLNLQNPEVVEHLLGAVDLWRREFGIDGLRLDAADCIDPEFFRRLRNFCKEKDPDFWLMGEIIHGDYNHWANPSMLDSVTNYECQKGLYSSHNDKNYFEIGYSLNRQFGNGGIYKNLCLYNFVDNHDVNRLASSLKNREHLPLVYTLLYTMPGVPSLYYGSEWGILGERDQTSDIVLRPCLELGKIPDANEKLCTYLGKLGKLRRSLKALQYGSYEQSTLRNEQYVFCRRDGESRVYVALNLSAVPQYVEFPAQPGKLIDLLSGGQFESNDGNYKLELPAYGARIFVKAEEATGFTLEQMQNAPIPTPQERSHIEVIENAVEVTEVTVDAGPIRIGRYQDIIGKEYQVIGVGKDQSTKADVVVYQELFGNCQLWVMPLTTFGGNIEIGGEEHPRFVRLS